MGFYEVKQIHIVIRIFERIDELSFCRKFFAIDQIQKVFGIPNRFYIFGVCVVWSVWILWSGGQVAFIRCSSPLAGPSLVISSRQFCGMTMKVLSNFCRIAR